MDVKQIITDAAKKIASDKALQKQFQTNPVKALEKVLNVDLPDDLLKPVIEGIKAKLTADKLEDAAGFLKGLIK